MFYLREALRLKPISLVIFFIWLVSGVAMVTSMGHGKMLKSMMNTSSSQTVSLPYFYALIDSDRPYERAIRKLRDLPGVSAVNEVPRKELEKSLKATLSGAGLEISDLLKGPAVAGVKIVFNRNLEAQGQSLIRDYLVRLIGESYITLGPIAKPDPALYSAKGGLESYRQYLPWIALFIFTLVWMWSWSNLLKQWKKRAFLIENYQRRSGVLSKIIVSVTTPFIFFAFVINIWFAPLELMALVTLVIFGLVMSLSLWRGGQWEVA